MATLFKIKTIWGDDAIMEMLSIIYDYIEEYSPNDDCKYWLRKNQGDYLLNYPDYKNFFKDNVYPIL